jgi:hypothetical protein
MLLKKASFSHHLISLARAQLNGISSRMASATSPYDLSVKDIKGEAFSF